MNVQVQNVQEEKKMTVLALVSAKPLESNVDTVKVIVDGLSHTIIYTCLWSKETIQILLPLTCSNLLHNISLDQKNVN